MRLHALVSRDEGIIDRERVFSDRLARLHAFTAALSEAATPPDVARATVTHGRAALDAATGAVWLSAGDEALLAHQVGYPSELLAPIGRIPIRSGSVVGEVVATGAPIWVGSRAELASRWPAREARLAPFSTSDCAFAVLPLEVRAGRIGAVAYGFPRPRAFSTEDRALLIAIARQSAQAIERARLYESERLARAEAEAAHRRTAFLFEASALLTSSLGLEETLASLARLAVPRVADWCAVQLAEDVARAGPAAPVVAHVDPSKLDLLRALPRAFPLDPDVGWGAPEVARSGRSELVEEVTEELLRERIHDPEQLRLLREAGLRSTMVVPMVARGRTLGVILLASSGAGRRYGREDLVMAESLGRRAALAIDNARLYGEAQLAIRARDDVLAIVSHDLRNPLHAIVMASNLLQRPGATAERTRQHAGAIERSARRMGRLIRDLLDLSRLEAGRFTLDRAPAEAAAVLADAAALIQPIAAEKAVALRVVEPPAGALHVLCDRERVLQVFSNLLGNAVNFTPAGGQVTLTAAEDDDEVRFSVVDTGPGVPPEDQPYIFDRYWKSRESRQGAGLGLSIARNIVDAHRGRIWVESRAGQGAAFHFTLPRIARPIAPAPATSAAL